MTLNRNTAEQITNTYARMARMNYRPAAPSDGITGAITAPLEQLNLAREALAYAKGWSVEENEQRYAIGCPNFPDRPALIFAVEAARLICGMVDALDGGRGRARAVDLLRAAANDLEAGR